MEEKLSEIIYRNLETENHEFMHTGFIDEVGVTILPINNFLAKLEDEVELTKYNIFVSEFSKLLHHLYAYTMFPEKFFNLDPFYEYAITLLNPNTLVLTITEKDDVEYFTELLGEFTLPY